MITVNIDKKSAKVWNVIIDDVFFKKYTKRPTLEQVRKDWKKKNGK